MIVGLFMYPKMANAIIPLKEKSSIIQNGKSVYFIFESFTDSIINLHIFLVNRNIV